MASIGCSVDWSYRGFSHRGLHHPGHYHTGLLPDPAAKAYATAMGGWCDLVNLMRQPAAVGVAWLGRSSPPVEAAAALTTDTLPLQRRRPTPAPCTGRTGRALTRELSDGPWQMGVDGCGGVHHCNWWLTQSAALFPVLEVVSMHKVPQPYGYSWADPAYPREWGTGSAIWVWKGAI